MTMIPSLGGFVGACSGPSAQRVGACSGTHTASSMRPSRTAGSTGSSRHSRVQRQAAKRGEEETAADGDDGSQTTLEGGEEVQHLEGVKSRRGGVFVPMNDSDRLAERIAGLDVQKARSETRLTELDLILFSDDPNLVERLEMMATQNKYFFYWQYVYLNTVMENFDIQRDLLVAEVLAAQRTDAKMDGNLNRLACSVVFNHWVEYHEAVKEGKLAFLEQTGIGDSLMDRLHMLNKSGSELSHVLRVIETSVAPSAKDSRKERLSIVFGLKGGTDAQQWIKDNGGIIKPRNASKAGSKKLALMKKLCSGGSSDAIFNVSKEDASRGAEPSLAAPRNTLRPQRLRTASKRTASTEPAAEMNADEDACELPEVGDRQEEERAIMMDKWNHTMQISHLLRRTRDTRPSVRQENTEPPPHPLIARHAKPTTMGFR